MGISFSFKWITGWGCAVPRLNSFTLIMLLETCIFSRLSGRVFCIIIAFPVLFFLLLGGWDMLRCVLLKIVSLRQLEAIIRPKWVAVPIQMEQVTRQFAEVKYIRQKTRSQNWCGNSNRRQSERVTCGNHNNCPIEVSGKNEASVRDITHAFFHSPRVGLGLSWTRKKYLKRQRRVRSIHWKWKTANGEKWTLALAQFQNRFVFNPCAIAQRMFHILLVSFYHIRIEIVGITECHQRCRCQESLFAEHTHICTACMLGWFNECAVLPQTNSLELNERKEISNRKPSRATNMHNALTFSHTFGHRWRNK